MKEKGTKKHGVGDRHLFLAHELNWVHNIVIESQHIVFLHTIWIDSCRYLWRLAVYLVLPFFFYFLFVTFQNTNSADKMELPGFLKSEKQVVLLFSQTRYGGEDELPRGEPPLLLLSLDSPSYNNRLRNFIYCVFLFNLFSPGIITDECSAKHFFFLFISFSLLHHVRSRNKNKI